MDSGGLPYYALLPLLVFGPLVFWVLYNFGLRDVFKMSRQIRDDRHRAEEEEKLLNIQRERKRGKIRPIATGGGVVSPLGLLGQGIAWALYLGLIGYLSSAPAYEYLAPEKSLIKLSFTHPGQRKVKCRKLSREEMNKLPPNMRVLQSCTRERWPVTVSLKLDGSTVFKGSARPAGLSKDGPSSFYEKFSVRAGNHKIDIHFQDDGSKSAKIFRRQETVTLKPAEILVIGFDSANKKITLK